MDNILLYSLLLTTGNTTSAVISGDENYVNLKDALGPVFNEINGILTPPSTNKKNLTLDVDGTEYNVDFFLGGDYKIKPVHVSICSLWYYTIVAGTGAQSGDFHLCLCLVSCTQG